MQEGKTKKPYSVQNFTKALINPLSKVKSGLGSGDFFDVPSHVSLSTKHAWQDIIRDLLNIKDETNGQTRSRNVENY